MSRINETRQILWHENCKCVRRLSVAVFNSKQIWNDDKCRCECRENLLDKIVCDLVGILVIVNVSVINRVEWRIFKLQKFCLQKSSC